MTSRSDTEVRLPSVARLRRRSLWAQAGSWTIAGRAVGAVAPPERALKVVVVGGHPGDPEYGCGGTVARYADAGHQVTLLYLNRGETPGAGERDCFDGSVQQSADKRIDEAVAACRILGAQALFSTQCNAHAVVDQWHYRDFTEVLSALDPDVVFNQWPIDNHPDHRAIANLTYEAWNRMKRGPALYYYEVSDGEDTEMFAPTDYVDVTAEEPRKREACYAHASQTPERYYPLQSRIMTFRGIQAGCAQAEAFIRHPASRAGLLPGSGRQGAR